MTRALATLLALVASLAFAQAGPGPQSGGITRGNFLPIPQYRTPGTGAQSYFVDGALGSDTNNCTASGASACLTMQGVVNKIPKLLRDQVTVTVANGNYACFRVAGFTYDTGIQNNNSALYFTGNLITATLASGSATGTSTAGSVGSNDTFGTLTDGAATWTVNDLRGRIITIGASKFIVSSNTGTVITTVGACSTCAGSVAYTVQATGWNINTACGTTPSPLNAGTANSCQICTSGNTLAYRPAVAGMIFENVGFTAAAGSGVLIADDTIYRLNQVMKTTGTGSMVNFAGAAAGASVFITTASNTGGTSSYALSGGFAGFGSLGNVLAYGTNAGLAQLPGSSNGNVPTMAITNSESTNSTTAGVVVIGGRANVQNSRFDCASSAGFGLAVGNTLAALTALRSPMAALDVASTTVSNTCGSAVLLYGPVYVDVQQLTATGATNGVLVNFGGQFMDVSGGTGNTITGGTNAISWDNGVVTSSATSDVTSGSCITTPTYGSRYCK